MRKRLAALVLAAVCALPLCPAALGAEGSPVPEDHWAYEGWQLFARGGALPGGLPDRADAPVSRGQAVSLLAWLSGEQDVIPTEDRSGIDLAWAVERGVLIQPEDPPAFLDGTPTRLELAEWMYAYGEAMGYAWPQEAGGQFTDCAAVSAGALAGTGILLGTGGTAFTPDRRVTVAEAVTALYRLDGYLAQHLPYRPAMLPLSADQVTRMTIQSGTTGEVREIVDRPDVLQNTLDVLNGAPYEIIRRNWDQGLAGGWTYWVRLYGQDDQVVADYTIHSGIRDDRRAYHMDRGVEQVFLHYIDGRWEHAAAVEGETA